MRAAAGTQIHPGPILLRSGVGGVALRQQVGSMAASAGALAARFFHFNSRSSNSSARANS
jgi:hypothetical protein